MNVVKRFDKLIKENKREELSDDDLIKLLHGRTKIVPYDEITNYKSAEQLLAPYGNAIILYLDTPNSGHWSTVINRGDHYEFFDSYGQQIDEVLPLMKHSGKTPYLWNLLEKTKMPVIWNPYKLQSDNSEIATCGYYCFLRIMYKDLPLKKFIKIFTNKKKSPDYIASLLTTLIAIENVLTETQN